MTPVAPPPLPTDRVTSAHFLRVIDHPTFQALVRQKPTWQTVIADVRTALQQGPLATIEVAYKMIDPRARGRTICDTIDNAVDDESDASLTQLRDYSAVAEMRREIGRRLSLFMSLCSHDQWEALVSVARGAADGRLDRPALRRNERITDVIKLIDQLISKFFGESDEDKICGMTLIADLLSEQAGKKVQFVKIKFRHDPRKTRRQAREAAAAAASDTAEAAPAPAHTDSAEALTLGALQAEVRGLKDVVAQHEREIRRLRELLEAAPTRPGAPGAASAKSSASASAAPAQPPVTAADPAPAASAAPGQERKSAPAPQRPPAASAPATQRSEPAPDARRFRDGFAPSVADLHELSQCRGQIVTCTVTEAMLKTNARMQKAGAKPGEVLRFRVAPQQGSSEQSRLVCITRSLELVALNKGFVASLDLKRT